MSGPLPVDCVESGSPGHLGSTNDHGEHFPVTLSDVEQSITSRFELQAVRHGERTAVKSGSGAVSYELLNRWANRVAHRLLDTRDRTPEPVGILMRKDAPAIATMLGVLKAGKFFVILDPRYPTPRLGQILEDCRAAVIVTDAENHALATSLTRDDEEILELGCPDFDPHEQNPNLVSSPDDLSCIVYTSGSTGRPKGVCQTHRMELHQWMRMSNALALRVDDRKTLFGSLAMGQAMTDVFMTLLSGAALFPWDVTEQGLASVARWLKKEEISIYRSTATLFRAWCDLLTEHDRFPKLRIVKVGSEPVAASDFERFKKHFHSGCQFVNALSSSEARTLRMLVLDHSSRVEGSMVPVGYPVDGMDVSLRDGDGFEVPAGAVGEIIVKSRYLTPGYWRAPEETRARFESSGDTAHLRIFRTGDLGRMRPDGCLTHLGRGDSQVHIRGFRIELAEVEMCLLGHPDIQESAVVERSSFAGDVHLVGFVVAAGAAIPPVAELRRYLGERLPSHMVPAFFMFLDRLPRTDNGKVDRRALPQVEQVRPDLGATYTAPRTPFESRLEKLWADVLGVDKVGVHDEFMALGGNSLMATRLVHRIVHEFRVNIPLKLLLEGSTIAHMAALLLEHHAGRLEPQDVSRVLDEVENRPTPGSSDGGPKGGPSS